MANFQNKYIEICLTLSIFFEIWKKPDVCVGAETSYISLTYFHYFFPKMNCQIYDRYNSATHKINLLTETWPLSAA